MSSKHIHGGYANDDAPIYRPRLVHISQEAPTAKALLTAIPSEVVVEQRAADSRETKEELEPQETSQAMHESDKEGGSGNRQEDETATPTGSATNTSASGRLCYA